MLESWRNEQPAHRPDALLFTGDSIRELTPEQIAAIGDFASYMFGVEMQSVHTDRDLVRTPGNVVDNHDDDRDPVPIRRRDVDDFAAEHHYPASRASSAWKELRWAHELPHEDPHPRIRYIGSPPARNQRISV